MPSRDEIIVEIRSRIDHESLFGEFVEMRGRGSERTAKCVFHDDNSPSMSINVSEGLFCCHVPDCGEQGDFIDFYMRVRSLTFTEAVDELARRVGLDVSVDRAGDRGVGGAGGSDATDRQERLLESFDPTVHLSRGPAPDPDRVIDDAVIQALHERLLATPAWMEFLADRRGLTEETVVEYQIGHDGSRYHIPIRNEDGECVNIRRYKPDASRAQDKMISWRTGFGQARLFPLDRVSDDRPIYIFEGEMDCLLARQLGLNAITATGGSGTWRGEQWNELFRNRDVVICYDADEAGRVGSIAVAVELSEVADSVKVVQIPLAEPAGADFTDYIVGHGHTVADFRRLVEVSPPFSAEGVERPRRQEADPIQLHLSQASRAEYNNQPVRVNVMVSGKTTAPFIVPQEVRAGCPAAVRGTKNMCEFCPVATAGGPVTQQMNFEGNDVLKFTNAPEEKLQREVKRKVGIPAKCGYARYDVTEALNVEEVQLIPEIERTDVEAPYVTRAAYYLGHGLQANRSYIMTGVTVPEPRKQFATHLINTAIQSQSNIDAFRLTSDVVERLGAFQPEGDDLGALWRHLGIIYDDLERHTRIYQRRDLMLAVDMVFHSVLQFRFQGERLTRGWTEALIVGDSRTGKTTIVQRILDYYGAGEFSTGENTSLAGLVGGLHKVGDSWALQWGRIPLNDRRLIVIDEAGNLPPDQIERMSAMRSSGIAEVIKVHTERTNSRTRQIWISNPRSPRPLSSFSQGVLAVKELVGKPEDIARFDMVVSAASGDVPLAVVNAQREFNEPEVFTRDLCHQRVMWAWSRTADQVVWAEGSEAEVLRLATEQGERYRYATEIPLVEPNEQRVKLARLAVSTAAMFFSASEDGKEIVVKPAHVQFAHQFLETLYEKPSLAFAEYADSQMSRYTITNERGVREVMLRTDSAVQSFMEQEQFTQRDIKELLSFDDNDQMRQAVTTLRNAGFLRRQGSSYYVKTPAAIRWLRDRTTELNGNGRGGHQSLTQLMEGDMPEQPPF
jgi:hypothetical protein